ncbi:MAG: phosphorylase [Okeania sp. SIO2F4]|uniref:phosphorylase family protein n=1 Tax=Okeania sp. SIO2F4 TaxID=2607790 RepID=UPI00142D13B3|nr:phosphorylase [Okeania sp. SIO2F4]NES06153.1 phosphorylase [Okeania sp. SIO2F4]
MIDTILVVQGQEFKSVKRGLSCSLSVPPKLLPLPIGVTSVSRYLHQCQEKHDFSSQQLSTVLVMGLCGSLSSQYQPGDVVIYDECVLFDDSQLLRQKCNEVLTSKLQTHLQEKASLVRGLTSDRFIYKAEEKQLLGKNTGAEVVDMEGFAILNFFAKLSISVAMVRVISDDCHYDLPDLSSAITSSGNLLPLPLAIAMFRQPIAALQLIRGSSKGLKVLQEVTSCLFSD